MTENVTVKISGSEKAVKDFLKVIDDTFSLAVKSKLMPNDKASGVHCFIDLNPSYIKQSVSVN